MTVTHKNGGSSGAVLARSENTDLNEELNTANVVSHIERVLPDLQKRE